MNHTADWAPRYAPIGDPKRFARDIEHPVAQALFLGRGIAEHAKNDDSLADWLLALHLARQFGRVVPRAALPGVLLQIMEASRLRRKKWYTEWTGLFHVQRTILRAIEAAWPHTNN
jgi:hypothetical protein